MATERKTYTYNPYTASEEVTTAGTKKTTAEDAYNTYLTNGYNASQDVINAGTNKTNAENAYNTYFNKGFTYGNQSAFNDVMGKILNGDKFSYDINGDALYQQYKDKYIQQGKMAMADTMGQAAAMTGGYGNSYAASVGNQAYQASLQNLNDVSLQLYQMAYDRYSQDRQDLYNQYGMLSNDRSTEYGMWADEGNRLGADRTYHSNAYDSAYNRDYGQWVDKGTMLNNDRTYYGNEYNNAYNRDYAEHTTTEGYNYQNVADANAWAQWQAGQNLAEEQFKFQKGQANKPTPVKPVTMSTDDYTYWTDKFSGITSTADAEALREQMAIAVGDPNMAYELYYQWANKYQNSATVPTTVYRGENGQTHMKN